MPLGVCTIHGGGDKSDTHTHTFVRVSKAYPRPEAFQTTTRHNCNNMQQQQQQQTQEQIRAIRRDRVTNNSNLVLHGEVTGNEHYRNGDASAALQQDETIQIFDKGNLEWRAATIVAINVYDNRVKLVRYEDTPVRPEQVNLGVERWARRGEEPNPDQFSLHIDNEDDDGIFDRLLDMVEELNGDDKIFLPGDNADDDLEMARSIGPGQDYRWIMMYNFCRAFITESRHVLRHRVLVISPLVLPLDYFADDRLPFNDIESREALRNSARDEGVPPLYTCDIVLMPFGLRGHAMLLYGNVSTRTLYPLDPCGPEYAHPKEIKVCDLVHVFNDLWHHSHVELATSTDFWNMPSVAEYKNVYADFDLPVQPAGPDRNCGPLVCAYAACIATGNPFNYDIKNRRQVENYITNPYNMVTPRWRNFAQSLRTKVIHEVHNMVFELMEQRDE